MKKLLCVLLTLCMALSLCSFAAAEEAVRWDGYGLTILSACTTDDLSDAGKLDRLGDTFNEAGRLAIVRFDAGDGVALNMIREITKRDFVVEIDGEQYDLDYAQYYNFYKDENGEWQRDPYQPHFTLGFGIPDSADIANATLLVRTPGEPTVRVALGGYDKLDDEFQQDTSIYVTVTVNNPGDDHTDDAGTSGSGSAANPLAGLVSQQSGAAAADSLQWDGHPLSVISVCTDESIAEAGLSNCLGSALSEVEHLALIRLDAGIGMPVDTLDDATQKDFSLEIGGTQYDLGYVQYYGVYKNDDGTYRKDDLQPHFALGFSLPSAMTLDGATLIVREPGKTAERFVLSGYPTSDDTLDPDTDGSFNVITVRRPGTDHVYQGSSSKSESFQWDGYTMAITAVGVKTDYEDMGMGDLLGTTIGNADHVALIRIDAGDGVKVEMIREITKMDFNLEVDGETYKLSYVQYYGIEQDDSGNVTRDPYQPHFMLGFDVPESVDPAKGTLVVRTPGEPTVRVSLDGYDRIDVVLEADTNGDYSTVTVNNEGSDHDDSASAPDGASLVDASELTWDGHSLSVLSFGTNADIEAAGLSNCLGSVLSEVEHLAMVRLDAGDGVPLDMLDEVTVMDFNLELGGQTYKLGYVQYYGVNKNDDGTYSKDELQPHFAVCFDLGEDVSLSGAVLVVRQPGAEPVRYPLSGFPTTDDTLDPDTDGSFNTITVRKSGTDHADSDADSPDIDMATANTFSWFGHTVSILSVSDRATLDAAGQTNCLGKTLKTVDDLVLIRVQVDGAGADTSEITELTVGEFQLLTDGGLYDLAYAQYYDIEYDKSADKYTVADKQDRFSIGFVVPGGVDLDADLMLIVNDPATGDASYISLNGSAHSDSLYPDDSDGAMSTVTVRNTSR